MTKPLSNGTNREPSGRFGKGNQAAKGRAHPLAARVHRLRRELFEATTPERFRRVCEALLGLAEGGDVQAIKTVLERVLGQPEALDLLQRVEDLEAGQGINSTPPTPTESEE